jgi:hypothetical protein
MKALGSRWGWIQASEEEDGEGGKCCKEPGQGCCIWRWGEGGCLEQHQQHWARLEAERKADLS